MVDKKEDIMKYETVLPVDFDGVFRFTNWTDEEFIGVWNKKEYHFPAKATSPMIIPEHSPLEIQHIRKKFAKDLAEIEFYKSRKYKQFMKQERNPDGSARLNSIHQSATYNLDDLTEGIQNCLKPLSVQKALVSTKDDIPLEKTLTRNDDGELNSVAIDKKASLRERALSGKGLNDK